MRNWVALQSQLRWPIQYLSLLVPRLPPVIKLSSLCFSHTLSKSQPGLWYHLTLIHPKYPAFFPELQWASEDAFSVFQSCSNHHVPISLCVLLIQLQLHVPPFQRQICHHPKLPFPSFHHIHLQWSLCLFSTFVQSITPPNHPFTRQRLNLLQKKWKPSFGISFNIQTYPDCLCLETSIFFSSCFSQPCPTPYPKLTPVPVFWS